MFTAIANPSNVFSRKLAHMTVITNSCFAACLQPARYIYTCCSYALCIWKVCFMTHCQDHWLGWYKREGVLRVWKVCEYLQVLLGELVSSNISPLTEGSIPLCRSHTWQWNHWVWRRYGVSTFPSHSSECFKHWQIQNTSHCTICMTPAVTLSHQPWPQFTLCQSALPTHAAGGSALYQADQDTCQTAPLRPSLPPFCHPGTSLWPPGLWGSGDCCPTAGPRYCRGRCGCFLPWCQCTQRVPAEHDWNSIGEGVRGLIVQWLINWYTLALLILFFQHLLLRTRVCTREA